jgi:hypothetical protein
MKTSVAVILFVVTFCMRAVADNTNDIARFRAVVEQWQKGFYAYEDLLSSNQTTKLAATLCETFKERSLTNVFVLEPGDYVYSWDKKPWQKTNEVIRTTPETTRAIVDSFLKIEATCTNRDIARYPEILYCRLDSPFYRMAIPYYLHLCTNYTFYPEYRLGNIIGSLAYGIQEHGVCTTDIRVVDAFFDTQKEVIMYMTSHGSLDDAMERLHVLNLWPSSSSFANHIISARYIIGRIENETSQAVRARLFSCLCCIISREAYDYYSAHGKPSYDLLKGKKWKEELRQYRERVEVAELQKKMHDKSGTPLASRQAKQDEKKALIKKLTEAWGKQNTRSEALAYWRTLHELDARRVEWEAAEVSFDSEDFQELATNCNGALIKDILKREIADTMNYTESASHVPGCAAMLLGMCLDAADVPWLIKYVNAAKPMAIANDDDDKYAVDISRVSLFGMMLDTACSNGRRAAVQACADALRLVHDPWVRKNTLEWLAKEGITPAAAPEPRTRFYDQSEHSPTRTNAPQAVTQPKEQGSKL